MRKDFVKDYFSFSKKQRTGLFILIGIILCCMIAPFFFPYFRHRQPTDTKAFDEAVADFEKARKIRKNKQKPTPKTKPMLFPFDPNVIGMEEWQKLGLSKKTATILLHYRQAGGRFRRKEDLKKIYGLSKEEYRKLAPYIRIKNLPKKHPIRKKHLIKKEIAKDKRDSILKHKKFSGKSFVMIDINKADSAEWSRLYGIGPVLSARIVRFRTALGGFYKIQQVAEVYNLPDSTFKHIKRHLNISTDSLKKLNINTASVEKLKSHPYVNYRLARTIKAFRDMHGPFDSLPELKELQLVNDQIYRKLAPYLTVK